MKKRCTWCGDDPLYVAYHDEEWGVPVRDDRTLFEFLILEGAQAGLSWITILRKREGYRELFDSFDPVKIARYSDKTLDKLLLDPKIVRNRLKVYGARKNARCGNSWPTAMWKSGRALPTTYGISLIISPCRITGNQCGTYLRPVRYPTSSART